MDINIWKNKTSDKTPIKVSKKEFWSTFLTLRNIKTQQLKPKEIDILSDYLSNTVPDKPDSNYKTYVKKMEKRNLFSKIEGLKVNSNQVNFHINLIIDENTTD